MVMMREFFRSSSFDDASTDVISSSVTVEAGWSLLYCCMMRATILSLRQSEMRVLNISLYVLP